MVLRQLDKEKRSPARWQWPQGVRLPRQHRGEAGTRHREAAGAKPAPKGRMEGGGRSEEGGLDCTRSIAGCARGP